MHKKARQQTGLQLPLDAGVLKPSQWGDAHSPDVSSSHKHPSHRHSHSISGRTPQAVRPRWPLSKEPLTYLTLCLPEPLLSDVDDFPARSGSRPRGRDLKVPRNWGAFTKNGVSSAHPKEQSLTT